MTQRVTMHGWRDLILSEHGPSAAVRLVLMAISMHMKSDGTGAFPGQPLISLRAGVSARSVRRHLVTAERSSWVVRVRRKGTSDSYVAVVPDTVHVEERFRLRTATEPPVRVTAPSAEHRSHDVYAPDNCDQEPRPSSGRLTLPNNSSVNSSESRYVGNTGLPQQSDPKSAEVNNLLRMGFTSEYICRLAHMKAIGITPEDIERVRSTMNQVGDN